MQENQLPNGQLMEEVALGGGVTSLGSSFIFNNNLNCRYLMIMTDGNLPGTDYFKQFDIFEKK
jgi:hypothetical protein